MRIASLRPPVSWSRQAAVWAAGLMVLAITVIVDCTLISNTTSQQAKAATQSTATGTGSSQTAATAPPRFLPSWPQAPAPAELTFWETIKTSTDPADPNAYLEQSPKGWFAAIVRFRDAPAPTPESARPMQQVAARLVSSVVAVPVRSAGISRAPGTKFRDCPDCPEMIVIPPGSFMMGSPSSEQDRTDDEGPQHQVSIARAFAVGIYDVTLDEYRTFVREAISSSGDACSTWLGTKFVKDDSRNWHNPGFSQTGRDPVVCVSWDDAQAYVQWLNSHVQGLQRNARRSDGSGPYRLLTEAEWEYAARAGTTMRYYWGDASGSGNANCAGCGSNGEGIQTSPSGSFPPNAFGLYDMAGNVWQWTADCYHEDYDGAPSDGSSWTTGDCEIHVARGGSWLNNPRNARSAYRDYNSPNTRIGFLGFRLARTLN